MSWLLDTAKISKHLFMFAYSRIDCYHAFSKEVDLEDSFWRLLKIVALLTGSMISIDSISGINHNMLTDLTWLYIVKNTHEFLKQQHYKVAILFVKMGKKFSWWVI